ncbi:MAG: TIM barrel protein [Spirochaetota bacterium]
MKTIKGPGLFLAQFIEQDKPRNSLEGLAAWAKGQGYMGIQIPTWDKRVFDLDLAYESETYCEEVLGRLADIGIAITELSTHLQGQMISVHPAYERLFDLQCPKEVRSDAVKRTIWATEELKKAAKVSRRLGLAQHVTFSGSLAWPYFYPYPQRPEGLVEECFAEQGRRWRPILDAFADEGVGLCFEPHPMEDIFDGDTFDAFLDGVGTHPSVA